MKIKRREIDFFSEHINSVDINIKFTKEEMLNNKLPFLDCAIRVGEDRRLQVEVYRKPLIWTSIFCLIHTTFTFTFMHFADTFIQSDLHCIQVTVLHFISSCFPWELNP